jgi:hypothetical protein
VKHARFGAAAGFAMSQYCGSSAIDAQVVRASRNIIGSDGGATQTPQARTAPIWHEVAVVETELQNAAPASMVDAPVSSEASLAPVSVLLAGGLQAKESPASAKRRPKRRFMRERTVS